MPSMAHNYSVINGLYDQPLKHYHQITHSLVILVFLVISISYGQYQTTKTNTGMVS